MRLVLILSVLIHVHGLLKISSAHCHGGIWLLHWVALAVVELVLEVLDRLVDIARVQGQHGIIRYILRILFTIFLLLGLRLGTTSIKTVVVNAVLRLAGSFVAIVLVGNRSLLGSRSSHWHRLLLNFEALRDQVAPDVTETEQIPQVVFVATSASLLRKLLEDDISCANDWILVMEVLYVLKLVLVSRDHPMRIVLKHHTLLVIKCALHDTTHLVNST